MLDLGAIKGRHDERRKLEKALTLGNDDTVELIAEIERLRAEVAWCDDMESAPENTPILVSGVGDNGVAWACEGYQLSDGTERDGTFWAANTHWTDAHGDQIYPTHWRPITPPQEKKP